MERNEQCAQTFLLPPLKRPYSAAGSVLQPFTDLHTDFLARFSPAPKPEAKIFQCLLLHRYLQGMKQSYTELIISSLPHFLGHTDLMNHYKRSFFCSVFFFFNLPIFLEFYFICLVLSTWNPASSTQKPI